jgi:hypothetical protein
VLLLIAASQAQQLLLQLLRCLQAQLLLLLPGIL